MSDGWSMNGQSGQDLDVLEQKNAGIIDSYSTHSMDSDAGASTIRMGADSDS